MAGQVLQSCNEFTSFHSGCCQPLVGLLLHVRISLNYFFSAKPHEAHYVNLQLCSICRPLRVGSAAPLFPLCNTPEEAAATWWWPVITTINVITAAHRWHPTSQNIILSSSFDLLFPSRCVYHVWRIRVVVVVGVRGRGLCNGNRSLLRLTLHGLAAIMPHCSTPVSRNPLTAKQLALMWSAWLH